MNIALINVVGCEGSTGKIVSKLANIYSEKGHVCKVFHGRGNRLNDGIHFKYGNKLDTIIHYLLVRITDKEGFYSTLYTKKIIKELKKFNPRRLIISNLHGHWLNIPLFIEEISKMDLYISWLMADEYPFTARCSYTNGCVGFKSNCRNCKIYKGIKYQYSIKEKYYELLIPKTVFSSVKYIVDKAKESTLLKNAKFDIKNTGIDTNFYYPVDVAEMKKNIGIDKEKVILLNVAPYSNRRKGVAYFLEAAKILEKDDRFVFINVGYDGNMNDLPSNFIAIPYVSNQEELREYYSMADVYVCTSTQDALPNACVEAMSCGTPLIAFNISGMPYIAEYPVLKLVEEISSNKLVEKIQMLTRKNYEISSKARTVAVDRYSFNNFADAILSDFID